ncbi:MAG: hypothetical protein WD688_24100 [Candidatus Binatia bacterium]
MTTGIRRGARRSKPHDLSDRIPAVWRQRSADMGTIALDLLGQSGIREMVALAVFLNRGHELITAKISTGKHLPRLSVFQTSTGVLA